MIKQQKRHSTNTNTHIHDSFSRISVELRECKKKCFDE